MNYHDPVKHLTVMAFSIEIYKSELVTHLYHHIRVRFSFVIQDRIKVASWDISGTVFWGFVLAAGLGYYGAWVASWALLPLSGGKKRKQQGRKHLGDNSSSHQPSEKGALVGKKVKAKGIFYKISKNPDILFGTVVPRVLAWLQSSFILSLTVSLYEYNKFTSRLTLIFKSRGSSGGLVWVKAARLCVMKFLEGNPMKAYPGINLNKHGLPITLGPRIIKSLLEGSKDDTRILLTILNASRALAIGTVPNYDPITKPRIASESYDSLLMDMEKYTRSFWRANGYQWGLVGGMLPRKLRWTSHHFSTKSGPNGHALWTCLIDLTSLPSWYIGDLAVVGGAKFGAVLALLVRWLRVISQLFPEWFHSETVQKRGYVVPRKISSFADKEDKVRVIAIGDYFSQTVLKPFHHYLFGFLRRIPQDHTHDQGGFLQSSMITSEGSYCSADLSAATDRFPIEVIKLVLKGRLPSGWVDSWSRLMVGLPFDSPIGSISYSVGNPMGFYSSWGSFSVSHHFILYYICMKLGLNWRKAPYALLGDDIVIKHSAIAEEYKRIMGVLGVEVSELKTHESRHFFEFAKRLFYKGQEVSPFPISALQEIHNKSYLICSLLIEQESKGWTPTTGIPEAVGSFATKVLHRKSKNGTSWCESSWSVERIIKVMRGSYSGGQFFNELATREGFHTIAGRFTDTIASNMLSNVAVELFADSNPSSTTWQAKSKVPLGELATQWVMKLTGLVESPNLELASACFDLIQAIPHVRGYGTVEETYLKLIAQARRIDTVEQGNWPKILRTMALPLDDRIFIQRTSHLISKGAMLVTKQLVPRLELLRMYPQMLDF